MARIGMSRPMTCGEMMCRDSGFWGQHGKGVYSHGNEGRHDLRGLQGIEGVIYPAFGWKAIHWNQFGNVFLHYDSTQSHNRPLDLRNC